MPHIRSVSSTLIGGYTLIEIMLVMGIIMALFGISGILVSDLIPKASVTAYSTTLLGDIRQQQLRAMSGEGASPQGIFFASDHYTLFSGSSYNANAADNIVTQLDEPYALSTTWPSAVLIFQQGTGEVLGYNTNTDTITIENEEGGGGTATIELNGLGVPTQLP